MELTCVRLFRTNAKQEEVIQPDDYLQAAGELLVIAALQGYVLTRTFAPESFEDNELKKRIGYNNACVLFDTDPARNVACALISASLYFLWTYVRLDNVRVSLQGDRLSSSVRSFCRWSMRAYAISMCVFMNVFLVRPSTHPALHAFFFAQFIVFRFFGIASNYVEHWALGYDLTSSTTGFLVAYSFSSVTLPILLAINFAYFDETRSTPVIPAMFTMSVDYMWFMCVFLTTRVQPRVSAPPLRRTYALPGS